MTFKKDMAKKYGQTVLNIKGYTTMARNMGREYLNGLVDRTTKEISMRTSFKDLVDTVGVMREYTRER